MKALFFNTRSAALAFVAVALPITSCSLPPREAWRQIQTNGLIAFLRNDLTAPVRTYPARPTAPPASIADAARSTAVASTSRPDYVGPPKITPAPVIAQRQTAPAPVTPPLQVTPGPVTAPRDIMPAHDKALAAKSVPSLPGFVRSPYTIPPRLVDVKGAKPGSSMICPYTQRAFIVPDDFVSAGTVIVSNTPPPVQPRPAMNQPPSVAVKTTPKPPSSNPPSASVFNNSKPAPTTPPANTAVATPPAKPTAPEIQFGIPIPGRPGFVNSPFAAKHQLVDVTGLPAGMDVKCPYTGKLFKVPAQDIVQQKALAAPGAPPAPEKK